MTRAAGARSVRDDAPAALADLVARWHEDDQPAVERWRERGADDASVILYLARARLVELIERRRREHRHVLVAGFPKSASTFTRKLLANVTGFRPYFLSRAGNDSSRDLDPDSIPLLLGQDTVSVEHLRATMQTVDLLRRLEIRPVVLVRNLLDTLVSSRDHLAKVPGARGAVAHAPADLHAWSPDDQHRYFVRMVAPWYLTFFASWQDAAASLDVLWVTYDEVTGDTAATARRILAHAGVDVDERHIESVVASMELSDVRLNRGVSGRGRREIAPEDQAALQQIADSFRGRYDFSLLGLAPPPSSEMEP